MIELSIITINYNNVKGLKQTIDSVVGQTFKDFEYIVIDNLSTDGSNELVKSYGSKITQFISEKDTGVYNAQNKGIMKAKGKYLFFLNSGDFLCDEQVLAKVYESKPIADIVYGNMKINWGNNAVSPGKMPDFITKEHMFNDTLWHPVSFIKKSLFDAYGLYNEKYKLVADYDFFFKTVIDKKVSTKHVDVFICEFNTEGLSSTKKNKSVEKAERRMVQEAYLTPEEIKLFEKKLKGEQGLLLRLKNWLKGN